MKARLPKVLEQLKPGEKRRIEDIVNHQVDEEEAIIQTIWLKMMCVVLHRQFGFGEKRLNRALVGWRKIYRENARCKTRASQEEWLTNELNKVFKDGFPDWFIQTLKEIGR